MNPVEQLKLYIPKFLTQKKTIILFFSLVMFFCAFFVVVYHPLGLLNPPSALTTLDYRLYSIILVLIGLVVLSISRHLLYLVQRRAEMKLSSYFIWVGVEFVVLVVSLTAAARWLNEDAAVPLFTQVGRVFAAVIILLTVPYIITFLVFMLQQKRLEIATLTNKLTESTVEKSAEVRDDVQLQCNSSDASGITRVYSGGYLFLKKGVTPTTSDFTTATISGLQATITIDATQKSIDVHYGLPNAITGAAQTATALPHYDLLGRPQKKNTRGITVSKKGVEIR